MKKVILLVSVLLSIGFSNLFALYEDYFTAFEGVPFAKSKISELNLGQTKMIAISVSLIFHEINNYSPFNDGKAPIWRYTFSYDNDEKIIDLFIYKINGNFKVMKSFQFSTDTLHLNNYFLGEIQDYLDIPDGLLDSDSDFQINLDGNEKSKIHSDINNVTLILSYGTNINEFEAINEFVWYAVVEDTEVVIPGFPPEPTWVEYLFSAKTGEKLDAVYLHDVDDIIESGFASISPNPATYFIKFDADENLPNRKAEIFNTTGLKVMEIEITDKIYVGSLAPGTYFVKYGNIIGKFVKM
jgi:hypothetical protein